MPSEHTCSTVNVTLTLRPAEADRLAARCKALSHPVRVQIMDILSRYGGQVCVCELEAQFELGQSTISHHLRVLREAGLVTAEKRGLWWYYTILPDALAAVQGWLGRLHGDPAAG